MNLKRCHLQEAEQDPTDKLIAEFRNLIDDFFERNPMPTSEKKQVLKYALFAAKNHLN